MLASSDASWRAEIEKQRERHQKEEEDWKQQIQLKVILICYHLVV